MALAGCTPTSTLLTPKATGQDLGAPLYLAGTHVNRQGTTAEPVSAPRCRQRRSKSGCQLLCFLLGARFARESLRTSGNAATTLNSADTVFVYDYCYLMRVLADQQASEHWWLKGRYKSEENYASLLLQLYRCGHRDLFFADHLDAT